MARTSEAEVRKIIVVDASITDLGPFMNAANMMVTTHCTDIEDDAAAIVETWLAAHLITIRDNRVSSESAGKVSQSFQFQLGAGLECSMYGAMAIQLDPTGGLAKWNTLVKKGKTNRVVTISWLGTQAV